MNQNDSVNNTQDGIPGDIGLLTEVAIGPELANMQLNECSMKNTKPEAAK